MVRRCVFSLNQLKAYCTRGGAVRAAEGMRQYPAALGIFSDVESTTRGTGAVAKLELKFARFELYQDETSDRLKGLPAFKAEATAWMGAPNVSTRPTAATTTRCSPGATL
jgi:hypothetical protein